METGLISTTSCGASFHISPLNGLNDAMNYDALYVRDRIDEVVVDALEKGVHEDDILNALEEYLAVAYDFQDTYE